MGTCLLPHFPPLQFRITTDLCMLMKMSLPYVLYTAFPRTKFVLISELHVKCLVVSCAKYSLSMHAKSLLHRVMYDFEYIMPLNHASCLHHAFAILLAKMISASVICRNRLYSFAIVFSYSWYYTLRFDSVPKYTNNGNHLITLTRQSKWFYRFDRLCKIQVVWFISTCFGIMP